MKSNDCVSLLNILQKIYNKATIYMKELILTPFSSFDSKCKKLNLMQKNLWKFILIASRSVSFFSVMEGVPPDSFQYFCGPC